MGLFTSKKSLLHRVETLEKELFITNRRLMQIEKLILNGDITIQSNINNKDNNDNVDFRQELISSIEDFLNAI